MCSKYQRAHQHNVTQQTIMPNQFYYIPHRNSCINVKVNDNAMETQQPIIMRMMRMRGRAHRLRQTHVLLFVTRRTIIDILDFSRTSHSMKTHQRHFVYRGVDKNHRKWEYDWVLDFWLLRKRRIFHWRIPTINKGNKMQNDLATMMIKF